MTKKTNLLTESALTLILLAFSVYLALSQNATSATIDGIKLWIACVLPALFPYLFITAILSSLSVTVKFSQKLSPLTMRLFNTGGIIGFCYFLSVMSGYPVGAKTVANMKNKGLITQAEAQRAAALCSTSSPMFLIGSVGSIMFRSNNFGLILFATHFLSSIIIGIIFSFYKRNEKPTRAIFLQQARTENLLYDGVYSAVISILMVGGLITVFYLLTEVLITLKILTPLIEFLNLFTKDEAISESISYGIFECTRALKTLSLSNPTLFTLPIAAALCGFGGLSVIAQSIAQLKSAKIKTAPFILSKIISAVINFIIGLIFSLIFL